MSASTVVGETNGDHGGGQTVAVVVGKLEEMMRHVLDELRELRIEIRELNTRLRATETTQADQGARLVAVEGTQRETARDAATRRPSWWAVAGGLAGVVAVLTGLLVLGGVLYGNK